MIETVGGDGSSVLDGSASAITNAGIFRVVNNSSVTIEGAIANNSSIQLSSTNNITGLIVGQAGATVTGGSIVMSDNGANAISGVHQRRPQRRGRVDCSPMTSTIRGAGTIGGNHAAGQQRHRGRQPGSTTPW